MERNSLLFKVIVVLFVICVVNCCNANRTSNPNQKSQASKTEETKETTKEKSYSHYMSKLYVDLLYSTSLRANQNGLNLYKHYIDIDKQSVDVYVDNYNGAEINTPEAYQALWNLISVYYDIKETGNDKKYFETHFYSIINNQGKAEEGQEYTLVKTIYGKWRLLDTNDVCIYESDTRNTVYPKDATCDEAKKALENDIKALQNAGFVKKEYQTIHNTEAAASSTPTVVNNNAAAASTGKTYHPEDYSNAYDFWYENRDTLSEDQAYELYEDEYGDNGD